MSERIIKKNLLSRFSAYLLILPFIPALRPLLNSHSTGELIIFILGFFLSLSLVIFSNTRPYLKITDDNLFVYLLYKYKPEIHEFGSIREIRILSPRKMVIDTKGFEPLDIRLRKKEISSLCDLLEAKGIEINKVYRNL
ncbi:hypothetical protein [Spirochaeta isovalerica]|uniref:PH domain-containing protein n=1 Tax=Spirochaeta isovalerica TaxID=150 RepID=A0A841R473_9SPIO|nr:hypothetical protein [Spirochaeta isovalerica]MBB6478603.1 hypothetical protein [Spirochaeta isovalerica]